MTETIVHVTTLSQWHNVLDILFKQEYSWNTGGKEYKDIFFKDDAARYLLTWPDYTITYSSIPTYTTTAQLMEHYEFMAQQKEDNEMKTYYVTQEQLDFLNTIYEKIYSLDELLHSHTEARNLFGDFSIPEGNAVLRYLGGDTSIEFKVKERLYRLWRIDENDSKVYMIFLYGTPDWTPLKYDAFTAPLEEIKKHKTVSWEIEEVK